ncbi:MAG: penicillin acylase family protein [Acidobacteriota bacterium]
MKRTIKYIAVFVFIVVLAGACGVGWFYYQVRQSLPVLAGEIDLPGLTAAITVERDSIGVPTIKGENRIDVARTLGFLHAQERFFQMDLNRRAGAGEMAELFGPALVEFDKEHRLHRFRYRSHRIVENLSDDKHKLLLAYTEGVNRGLEALGQKPFEYLVLREDPVPWKPEDSVLVIFSMFFNLTARQEAVEKTRGLLREVLPEELAEFLNPPGTEWDAPVEGSIYETPTVPGPEIFNLREGQSAIIPGRSGPLVSNFVADGHLRDSELNIYGSNNWAVSGERTDDGHPIVANDMHLGLRVPNTWYRARFEWHNDENTPHAITGVTLPGVPAVVVGSNGHIAWAFTNSGGDWVDLVRVETHPDDSGLYLTPDGYVPFDKTTETVKVKGEESQAFEIVSTVWGPLTSPDHEGNPRALRWLAHLEEGVNFNVIDLENAMNLEEAIAVARRSGIPPQNFVCVDATGNIGWTIIGRIPRRIGFSGKIPTSWADGSRNWDGFLDPEEYPGIINPETEAIWTANARIVDGEMVANIGNGDYALGARQKQIRDALLNLDKADEIDMLDIQLDDRALLLERWRRLILDLLEDRTLDKSPGRADFRDYVENGWSGKASVDSVGYVLVRRYRFTAFENVYGWLTEDCRQADEDFRFDILDQWEGPLWKLVTERPVHLLDPRFESWDQALLSFIDQAIESLEEEEGIELGQVTWGRKNRTQIRHPLSQAIPFLSRWLDMPSRPLPGDALMPRVQRPSSGASERFAVSPGREEDGYMHMPCGQSGHPLSPFYRSSHEAWEEGLATPFLPGEAVYSLKVVPGE